MLIFYNLQNENAINSYKIFGITMIQIGSFVPAKSASLRLVDKILTIIGHEDGPENNASSFQVQVFFFSF